MSARPKNINLTFAHTSRRCDLPSQLGWCPVLPLGLKLSFNPLGVSIGRLFIYHRSKRLLSVTWMYGLSMSCILNQDESPLNPQTLLQLIICPHGGNPWLTPFNASTSLLGQAANWIQAMQLRAGKAQRMTPPDGCWCMPGNRWTCDLCHYIGESTWPEWICSSEFSAITTGTFSWGARLIKPISAGTQILWQELFWIWGTQTKMARIGRQHGIAWVESESAGSKGQRLDSNQAN